MAQDDWQQYLDELFLLARRVDERSHQLTELAQQQQAESQQLRQSYKDHQTWVTQQLSSIAPTLDEAKQYLTMAYRYMIRAVWVFVAVIFLGVLMVFGGFWWKRHIHNELADTQTQLVNLQFKLQHTPTYARTTAGVYIRVVPDTAGILMRHDQDLSGTYAKIWYPS